MLHSGADELSKAAAPAAGAVGHVVQWREMGSHIFHGALLSFLTLLCLDVVFMHFTQ